MANHNLIPITFQKMFNFSKYCKLMFINIINDNVTCYLYLWTLQITHAFNIPLRTQET